MSKWVVVASRDGARIFSTPTLKGQLQLVLEIKNPEGKLKNRELVSDKHGNTHDRGAVTQHAYAREQDPREHIMQVFFRELAKRLGYEQSQKNFDGLVLIAEPHTLGVLRTELTERLDRCVNKTIPLDLFKATEDDIRTHLLTVA
jgi:protein required for attachment to host cells